MLAMKFSLLLVQEVLRCEATQQQHKDTAAGIKHLMNYNMKNWTALNVNQKKIQRLLGNPQHSVLIGRERRAVSIPTHFRLKSILLALGSSAASRRVSMGDQPIYLDSTPLLNSPVSGILVPANRNDNNLRFSIMCSCNFLIVVAGIEWWQHRTVFTVTLQLLHSTHVRS